MNTNIQNEATEDYASGGDSKVARAIHSIRKRVTLALDLHRRPVAIYKARNHFVRPIHGASFIREIRRNAYDNGDFLKSEDIKEITSNLSAIAEFDGAGIVPVFKRVAEIEGGIEIDTGDDNHTRFRIANGEVLNITEGSETLFERTEGMLPYPVLSKEGDIELLKKYVRLTDIEFYLFVGWLCYTLSTPRSKYAGYCLLILIGTMGSGKSFFCKEIIRSFVDPVTNPISLLPKTPKDLAIASKNAHLQIIDNIRTLSTEWSDVLCSFATSGTLTERALYTNDEGFAIQVHSPIVLNGIHHFAKEADLVSRTITFHLEPMLEIDRKEEKDIVKALDADKPQIFTGLLNQISQVLAVTDDIQLKHSSRIMGFVKYLAGMEIVLGFEIGILQLAYEKNIKTSLLESLIEEPFPFAVLSFASNHKEPNYWTGTPSEFLLALSRSQPKRVLNSQKLWPQNAIAQSKRLKMIEKTLNSQGVVMKIGDRGKRRKITIGIKLSKTGENS